MDFDEELGGGKSYARGDKSGNGCLNFWRGDAEISTRSDFLPHWAVALYRTVALGLSMYTLFRYTLEGSMKFDFLTVWTLVGTCCAFFIGACSATSYSLTLKASTSLFYHVFTSAALLSTVFFWALVYENQGVTWARIFPHGISLALLVIDILFLSRLECRPWHIAVLVGYLVTYLGFMFIRLAVTGKYTYRFLDHRTQAPRLIATYYTAVVLGAIGCGIVVLLLSRAARLFRKKQYDQHHHHHQDQPHENKLMELDD